MIVCDEILMLELQLQYISNEIRSQYLGSVGWTVASVISAECEQIGLKGGICHFPLKPHVSNDSCAVLQMVWMVMFWSGFFVDISVTEMKKTQQSMYHSAVYFDLIICG